jgi:hypothetical protein
MEFLDRDIYKSPLPNFTDIRPVGAALIRADEHTADGEMD